MDYLDVAMGLMYDAQRLLSNSFIYFVAVLVATFILTKLIIFILEKITHIFTKKTKTDVDDRIIEAVRKPLLLIVMLYGLHIAVQPFLATMDQVALEENILQTIGLFIGIIVTNRIFDILSVEWAKHFEKISKVDIKNDLLPLMRKVGKTVIFLFGLVFILSLWGIEIGPIIASLGVAGIVIGLALQDPLSNVFSGISLILDKAYKVDDIVVLDTGENGLVYDIGLRSTRIKTWDNEILTVPNKKMAGAVIKNLKKPDMAIKTTINFGVEYGSDPEQVKDVVSKAINKIKAISKVEGRETLVRFMGFGPSSLDFVAMFWVDDLADKWTTHQEVMNAIYNSLNKAKIGIPFPITTVYLNDGTKKESSDKSTKKK